MTSNYSAGVPIKKRRFPLIRPPSPPAEEQSVINYSLQSENSSPSEQSTLSNAGLSDAIKESLLAEKKGNPDVTNVKTINSSSKNYSVKVEQPSHTIHSVSRTDLDSKEKLVGAEKSADAIKSVKAELNLAPIEAPALTIGTDLSNKQKKVENSTQELVKTPCITELSLAVKEPVVSAIEGHNGERSHQNCESRGPVSLNLSLISGNSNQCKGDNVDLNTNSDMHANRSNWDLNTTMDAWNGSVVDEASGQGTVDGCNTIGGTHDVKPSICSVGIFGDRVTSKGQNFEKSKCRSAGALSSHLLGQPCNSEDNLHLGLSPSFSLSNLSQKPSSSSAILNSSWGIANSGLGKAFELTGTVNQINIGNVKSEPLDESIKHGFTGATAIPKGLPDIRAVKRELVERFNAEALKSFNFSAPKLVDRRSIKPEPVREDIQETVKKMEGTLNQSDKQMVEAMDNRGKTTSSAALSTSGEVPNSFEHSSNTKESRLSREVPQEKPESSGQVLSETMSTPVGLDGNASNLIMEVPHETSLSIEVPHETNLSREVPHETNLGREVPHETNLSREVPHDNNLSREVPQEKFESAGQVLIETVSVGHDGNLLNVSSLVDTAITDDKNIDDTERCRLKFMEEVPPNSRENGEGSASDDEEKINLSGDMLEEDSYDFDSESDASHNLETAMDAEHNNGKEEDFEDGEVRESLVHTELEGHICEKRELQHFNSGDSSDNKQLDFVGLPSEHPSTSSSTEDEPTKTAEPSETNNDSINKFVETAHDENNNKGAGNKDCILQKPLAGGMPAIDGDQKRCSTTSPIRSVVMSKRKDGLKAQETEQSYYQATSASQGNSAAIAQGLDENVKNTNVLEESVSPLPKAEASLTIDYAAKDADNGGNKSRIINLPRASNMPSPGQTRTISGSSLPSRAGREKLTDVELEEIYRQGRDEIYFDASHKFPRERHQDHQSRNSRFNFVRGRGRISSRIDSVHGDWNSEREFAREFYGPTEFHVPRHKYASQPGSDFNGYNVGLNGDFVSIGRGGRKIFNDEASVFPHLPRRRSPGGRVGPPGRGLDMVRRVPRHISLSGCIGEDGTELVGPRRGEKFIRGLPNDNTDPIYTHPQGPYDGLDGHFVRSNRNFLPMQRRGIPRVRSKSPIDSRTRSPGTWSPARRRSPDRFGGHPELPNRRSPPIFRMERMRSPDHSCFPGEMVGRRHGSPYMSRPPNELRDMDSSHDLGHPRSAIPNRSPSGRVLLRNTRRFDIVDPHERTDSDGYFGRPMHSGRFQELDADGTVEDRRRFGERRGPIRPFRPPYNGAEGENFHINAGDGPRPFRFCPEDGPEFHERGNLREREFDRRIKNRPGNGPRRTRNIEEQEGNYRHGGQVWHDNGFDDMSRIKRKKF